jgi:putative transposase
VSEKFAFIDAKKAQYPIVKMCTWLDVSTSGYYEWRDRPASASAQRRDRLATLIQVIFDESDRTYGYRRIHAALARQGEDCCPELVREIMRELGLVPCQPRPWRPITTQPGEGAESIPDLVARDFTAAAPGTKLVGDITYLLTWQGFAYLATVIDCCTKECIGYAIADHMRAELVATRCVWPPVTTASNLERSSTSIEDLNTSVKPSQRPPPSSTSDNRLDALAHALIMRSRNRSTPRSKSSG